MQKKNVRKLVKYWEQLMNKPMDSLFRCTKLFIMPRMVMDIRIMLLIMTLIILFIMLHIILLATRYLQLWTM
jgi:hypothetical protein